MSLSSISNVGSPLSLAVPASRLAPRSPQGGPDRVQQHLTAEGLVEKRDRAGLQRSPPRRRVAVSRQDDNRYVGILDRQLPEEIEAAHPAHPQIEQHATSAPALGRSQERFRGRERLDAEAHRPQQISERPTERFVIVYDADHRPVLLVHASSPALVNVEVESIYCQARASGGTRLSDLGGVGALRGGELPAAAHIFCSTCRGPRAWHRLRKAA